ncbi:MAG TPA: dihydrofolate reductase family protein [Cytophagaceae bacterium]|jgi:dihydrofolate reductase|nr:dihydrofolate reductase family protein [Cytophagaceae bacterium]
MRKVMFAMNISIDGCYEHTRFSPDEELMDYFTRLMQDTGVIVYGRKTYELMVPFWPEVAKNKSGTPGDIAFAEAMTPIEKIVLSRTLKNAAENTRIVSENPEGLIRELKEQPGKKIAFSSTSLLPRLLGLDLIDQLYLVVHPALVGENKRLFENFLAPEKRNFQLEHTHLFKSGVIALHYQKNE